MKTKEDLLDDVDKRVIDKIVELKREEGKINREILDFNKMAVSYGVQITGLVLEEGPLSQRYVNFEILKDPRKSIIDIEKKIEQLKIEQLDAQDKGFGEKERIAGFGIWLLEWVIGKEQKMEEKKQ